MRLQFYLLAILLCLPISLWAQKVDYNKIILPTDSITDSYEEKLVQVAWANYPKNEALKSRIRENEAKVVAAKLFPLTNLMVSAQFNAFNQSATSSSSTTTPGQPTVAVPNQTSGLPRVGFGLGFGIGSLLLTPSMVRQSREQLRQAVEDVNQQKLAIRSEVLKRFHEFQAYKDMLAYQLDNVEQGRTMMVIAQRQFETGEATLQEYNEALRYYNETKEKSISSQYKLKQAKVALEELLGVKLEEIK